MTDELKRMLADPRYWMRLDPAFVATARMQFDALLGKDHSPDAGKMVADHIVDPNKMAAEPAGDLEKQISDIIFEHVDFSAEDGGTTVTGVGSAARAILALFQPQMEAAEGLLQAAEAASAFAGAQPASMDQIAKRDAALQDLAVAAAQYRSAGLGRESHD